MRSAQETRLDFLLGDWTSLDRTHPGPSGPGGTSEGTASYGWEVGNRWLVYDFRSELPGLGPYEVRGGVAYDETLAKYRAFAFNNLGNLLIYEGRWENDDKLVFTLVHPQRREDTRITYIKDSDDKVRIISERPAKEGGRETYFETTLSR